MKALVLVFGLLLACPAFAQTPSDKPTPNEKREAQQLARAFARRLQRTKDLAPLVDKYFVSNFLDGYLQDRNYENVIFLLDRKVLEQISRAELRRYVIAELNWFYLSELYVFTKYSPRSTVDIPVEKTYPADVIQVYQSDPTIKSMMDDSATSEQDATIKTVERLTGLLQTLDRAASLLRKHARQINAGRTQQYRESVNCFDLYDPWLQVCEAPCLALPKGTRLIGINVPSLQLQLAKVNGRLRIVWAGILVE
jgi:hypothetical protein